MSTAAPPASRAGTRRQPTTRYNDDAPTYERLEVERLFDDAIPDPTREAAARAYLAVSRRNGPVTVTRLRLMWRYARLAGRHADAERAHRLLIHARRARIDRFHALAGDLSAPQTPVLRASHRHALSNPPELEAAAEAAIAMLLRRRAAAQNAAQVASSGPVTRTPGRRRSRRAASGGSPGDPDPGDSDPGAAAERATPAHGRAVDAFRAAVADLVVVAYDWDVVLRPALSGFDALAYRCRQVDFAAPLCENRVDAEAKVDAAIRAVGVWRDEVVRRLRRQRYDLHEDPRAVRSAA